MRQMATTYGSKITKFHLETFIFQYSNRKSKLKNKSLRQK